MTEQDGLRFTVSKRDAPFVFSRGAVRIDHYNYPWGEGFHVGSARGGGC